MSNFSDLLNYFRIGRRAKEAKEQSMNSHAEVYDESYFSGQTELEAVEVITAQLDNMDYYLKLQHKFVEHTTFYLFVEGNSRSYYLRRETPGGYQYHNLADPYTEEYWFETPQNDNLFLPIPILSVDYKSYYYDVIHNRVIRMMLEEVFVFGDLFSYKPENFSDYPDGDYTYNFLDHEGNETNWKRWLNPFLSAISPNQREVRLSKSSNSGRAYMLPLIEKDLAGYTLKYYFRNDFGPKSLALIGEVAIELHFTYIGACLSYLNQTVFYQLEDPENFETDIRKAFIDNYKKVVVGQLENTRNENITAILGLLYYIPQGFVKTLNKEFLWDVVNKALSQSLTNYGTDSEDILLTLLHALLEMEGGADAFLKRLLVPRKDKKTIFGLLYERMNGDNFVKTIQFLRNTWLQSAYKDFSHADYQKTNDPQLPVSPAPLFLPYKSKKYIGFFASNKNLDFQQDDTILVTPDDSVIDNIISVFDPNLGDWVNSKLEDGTIYNYHPFYPILLADVDQETAIDLPRFMPAFFLKANEDKAFWSNVMTSIEYGVDIITTFSGVGNIAKFRHLARVAKVASRAQKFNKAQKFASVVSKIHFAVGAVELASGAANILIRLSGVDTPFSRALQQYLFYLELLSLGGELTVAIKKGLRKSAEELVATPEKRAEFEDKVDELIEETKNGPDEGKFTQLDKEELLEHLDEAAGLQSVTKMIKEIPGIKKGFVKWFDEVGQAEFDLMWNHVKGKRKITGLIRQPGALHEWLMCSRANVFKQWGVSMKEIKALRTGIDDVVFKNPPGWHGGTGSTKAHNEILKLIDSSKNYKEFKKKLRDWADNRLEGGKEKLPKGLLK